MGYNPRQPSLRGRRNLDEAVFAVEFAQGVKAPLGRQPRVPGTPALLLPGEVCVRSGVRSSFRCRPASAAMHSHAIMWLLAQMSKSSSLH